MNSYGSINQEIFNDRIPLYKDIIDFIGGGASAYMMIRGVKEVFDINFESQIPACIMFTAMPYINDRLIQYIRRIWISSPVTSPEDYVGIKSRLVAASINAIFGTIAGVSGTIKEVNTLNSVVLATVGIFAGRGMEIVCDELFNNPDEGINLTY